MSREWSGDYQLVNSWMNMILETPSNIPVDSSVQGVTINAGTKTIWRGGRVWKFDRRWMIIAISNYLKCPLGWYDCTVYLEGAFFPWMPSYTRGGIFHLLLRSLGKMISFWTPTFGWYETCIQQSWLVISLFNNQHVSFLKMFLGITQIININILKKTGCQVRFQITGWEPVIIHWSYGFQD